MFGQEPYVFAGRLDSQVGHKIWALRSRFTVDGLGMTSASGGGEGVGCAFLVAVPNALYTYIYIYMCIYITA